MFGFWFCFSFLFYIHFKLVHVFSVDFLLQFFLSSCKFLFCDVVFLLDFLYIFSPYAVPFCDYLYQSSVFIRPFEKRDVLCRGNVRPSVCPSVRPSVRPRFPDFSSTCFEISIWNLVYTFSRWHDMSSLSCITIGSFWPSLQPKVGQTHFLQSWPHKSR